MKTKTKFLLFQIIVLAFSMLMYLLNLLYFKLTFEENLGTYIEWQGGGIYSLLTFLFFVSSLAIFFWTLLRISVNKKEPFQYYHIILFVPSLIGAILFFVNSDIVGKIFSGFMILIAGWFIGGFFPSRKELKKEGEISRTFYGVALTTQAALTLAGILWLNSLFLL